MIPLRYSTRSHTFPLVTVSLIILNLYIFFQQSLSSSLEMQRFILTYAFIPAELTARRDSLSCWGFVPLPVLTSLFLHGGWFHVLFNMLYLWIFGDNIEDKLGHLRFFFFYLAIGIAGNLVYYLTATSSPIPLVGASGAIAGLLGSYLITFPKAKITTLFFVFFFVFLRKIPAVFFLLFWFIIQIINGLTSTGIAGNPVAWWAHIGGFIIGLIFMPLFSRNKTPALF